MIFLGIDAGGTKTIAVAADINGEQLRTAQGAPGAISAIGVKGVNSLITDLLKKLDLSDSLEKIQAATFGFSGVGRVDIRKSVEDEIKKIGFTDFRVITDGELLHYSAFGESDGILLEAGTGSVCINRKNNLLTQIGGWGYLLGDNGGGFQIGRSAIKHALLEVDKNLPVSILSSKLMGFYQVKKRRDLVHEMYFSGRAQEFISSSALMVCELADQGDTDALIIVEDAANHLFSLLKIAIDDGNSDELIKIACAGSILSNDSPVLDLFNKKLENIGYNYELVNISVEPAAAGVLYAVNSSGEEALEQLLNSLKGMTA